MTPKERCVSHVCHRGEGLAVGPEGSEAVPEKVEYPGRHGRDSKPHCSCMNSPQFLPGQYPTNQ